MVYTLLNYTSLLFRCHQYGENIFASTQANSSAERAVSAWYEEKKDYTYGEHSPQNNHEVG